MLHQLPFFKSIGIFFNLPTSKSSTIFFELFNVFRTLIGYQLQLSQQQNVFITAKSDVSTPTACSNYFLVT